MKKLKIIGIILIAIIVIFTLFVIVELTRFNNHLGVEPLIKTGVTDFYVGTDSNLSKEKMHGIGFTVEYEYFVQREENSDNQINEVISGEFKLFDKIILSAWAKWQLI